MTSAETIQKSQLKSDRFCCIGESERDIIPKDRGALLPDYEQNNIVVIVNMYQSGRFRWFSLLINFR